MPPNIIILASMNVKVYSWPLTFRKEVRQQILREGSSVNFTFLHRSFLNLTLKNYENMSTVAEVIIKNRSGQLTHGIGQLCSWAADWQWRNAAQVFIAIHNFFAVFHM